MLYVEKTSIPSFNKSQSRWPNGSSAQPCLLYDIDADVKEEMQGFGIGWLKGFKGYKTEELKKTRK
jgi:hypothetical protein